MPPGSSSEAPVISPGPSRAHSPATPAWYQEARDVHEIAARSGGPSMWNKDEVRGKADQLKGKIKQGTGDVTNDERMRDEGEADEAAGKVEEAVGKGRRKVGDAIKDLGDDVGR